ncbi:MAG TPA: hypothetical protein V6C97_13470 [Oculatellaceae cyanobacterium]
MRSPRKSAFREISIALACLTICAGIAATPSDANELCSKAGNAIQPQPAQPGDASPMGTADSGSANASLDDKAANTAVPAPNASTTSSASPSSSGAAGSGAPDTSAPSNSTGTSTGTGASTANTTSAGSGGETAPGPLLEKRKNALSRIMAAKKQGIGISGYLAEYNRIEDMVKAGQPETAYESRLTSLVTGIDEQIKRSAVLKTQHPVSTSSSSGSSGSSGLSGASGSGPGSGGSSGGGGLGGLSNEKLSQLKSKYGDKIPPDIAEKLGNLSPEQKERLMQSDMLKKLLGH